MKVSDFNALPGGPPLPADLDPADPMAVEKYMADLICHAQVTARRDRFSKGDRKAYQVVTKHWPEVLFSIRVDLQRAYKLVYTPKS